MIEEGELVEEEESKILILKTIANRINTEVSVKVSLSTLIGKSGSDAFDKLPALTAILQHAEETVAKLVRAKVYIALRRYLNDEESIGRVMEAQGFTLDDLQEELEKIQDYLEVNDLQVESQLPELDELNGDEHIIMDENGFRVVPGLKLEDFEMPPFMPGDITFGEDGTKKIILPPGKG